MTQLKFDKKGILIPQKINYDVKHDERDKEFIDNECNFEIKYNKKGDFKFIEKNKKKTKEDEINEIIQKICKRVPKL